MRQLAALGLIFLSACSTSKKLTPSICDNFLKSTKVHVIKGTQHCESILMANGVVIRREENNYNLLTHVDVLQCPDSYKTYGDIGINGVIVESTKQTFNFVNPSNVDFPNSISYEGQTKVYFLNGFLIANDSLKISRNAIKRVEVLKSNNYFNAQNSDSAVLINIWTLTKKEVRKSLRKCKHSYE